MQVGSLVRYCQGGEKYNMLAIVTKINCAGGTVQAIDITGKSHWLVTSNCEIISSHP